MQCIIGILIANLGNKFVEMEIEASLQEKVEKSCILFFEFVKENIDFYQVLRETEFLHEDAARSFYDAYIGILARNFGLSLDADSNNEIFLLSLVGMQTFFAMKFILWDKNFISPEGIQKLAKIAVQGIWNKTVDCYDKCKPFRKAKAKKDNRNKILHAAELIFGKYCYDKASIAEIAKKAGISVGAFYLHFSSKKQAFEEVTCQFREDLMSCVFSYSQSVQNRIDIEVLALWAFFQFIKKHRGGYKLIREAEFLDLQMATDYYLFLFHHYSKKNEQRSQLWRF